MTRALAWGLLGLTLAAGLYAAGAATVHALQTTARADERARLVAENTQWTRAQLATQRAAFERVVDSLGRVVREKDTTLARQLARARAVLVRPPVAALDAPVVGPRLASAPMLATPPAGGCVGALDSLVTACETFRTTATAALAAMRQAADSAHRADSAAAAQADMRARIAAVRQDEFARRLARATTGRTIERTVCGVAAAGNLFTLWRLTK